MAGKRKQQRAPKGVSLDDLITILDGDEQVAQLSRSRMKTELAGRVPGKVVDEYFATSATRQRLAKPGKLDAKYVITAPPKSFQIDVANYQAITSVSQSLVLNIIDILSRCLWAFPLKNNKMETVMKSYKSFLKSVKLTGKPEHVSMRMSMVAGDMQFASREFTGYNEGKHIATYVDIAKFDHITPGGDRLGLVDRVTGTIRRRLELMYAKRTAGTWQALVNKAVTAYNAEPHSTLAKTYNVKRMTPNEAWGLDANTQLVRYKHELGMNREADAGAQHWAPGESVRILEYRGGKLGKNPDPYWSDARLNYTVSRREGYKYFVKDASGQELVRRFRNTELKAVRSDERQDDAGLQVAKENRQRATARRTVKQKERIEPDEAVLAGPAVEAQRGLPANMEGKSLADLEPKRGQWIIVDAEGQEDTDILLRFSKTNPDTKRAQTCYVWVGKVSRVKKGNIYLQHLAAVADRSSMRKLSSRKLSFISGDKPLDGETSAEALLYLGPVEWGTTGKPGSLPKDVVKLVEQRYNTATPE